MCLLRQGSPVLQGRVGRWQTTAVPPLPRRAPDGKRHVPRQARDGVARPARSAAGADPPASVRAACDYGGDEAPPEAPRTGRRSTPYHRGARRTAGGALRAAGGWPPEQQRSAARRRVPGANNTPEPPAQMARGKPLYLSGAPQRQRSRFCSRARGHVRRDSGGGGDPVGRRLTRQPAMHLLTEPPLVPAQRSSPQPQRRPARPPGTSRTEGPRRASLATPMTRAAMWAYLGQAEPRRSRSQPSPRPGPGGARPAGPSRGRPRASQPSGTQRR